jgi:sugar phosphate isomerase/epimerase
MNSSSRRLSFFLILILLGICIIALPESTRGDAAAPTTSLWDHDNLVAWCVVPFDARKRGPEERAEMLQRLGFKKFAYDWRGINIPTFDAEIEAMQKHNIELVAWWSPDNAGDPTTKIILEAFKRHNIHPQLWVMGGGGRPAVLSAGDQQQRVEGQAQRMAALEKMAAPYGVQVEIYSHNGWGGMVENELADIDRLKEMGITDVGIVYNFSHAHDGDHDDTVHFPALWDKMKSHVVAVDITGMGDPGKIIYPSQGIHELEMMRTIQESGWRGPIGLIAEKGGDAEITLGNYIKGLDWLAAELKQPGSGGPPPFGPPLPVPPSEPQR